MFRKFGTVNFVFVAERVSVLVEAVFESVLRKSDVICAVVVGTIGHVGTVNQAFCEAISFEGTGLLNFAVAFPFLAFLLGVQNFLVVRPYDACHVGHATVTDLGVISIKNLVKLAAGWKVFVE